MEKETTLININYSLNEEINNLANSLIAKYIYNDTTPIKIPDNFKQSLTNIEKKLTNDIKNKIKSGKCDYETLENCFNSDIKKHMNNKDKLEINTNIDNTVKTYLEEFKTCSNLNFKFYKKYNIFITKYGSGGSYYADLKNNKAIIYVRQDAKNGKCIDNIFHEIVHLAIEDNIVQKYKLNQNEKESLVDFICTLFIKDFKIQDSCRESMSEEFKTKILNTNKQKITAYFDNLISKIKDYKLLNNFKQINDKEFILKEKTKTI